ncbi:hypothetical protein [Francisella sp. SYW-9]|uniref:hypothetical protein n=1 Tax=Francisella sp. SYW-9 TaxID=2610888 RepID=UPI00123E20E6|nr:hypothetical protein [Francisella sp. SYW-9]
MYYEISKESYKYLEVQIYGHRGDESLKRFNRVNLTQDDIKALEILQKTFYFGDQSGALERLGKAAIKATLAKLEKCCSLIETNLVLFFYMLVECDGHIDIPKYEGLEKMYNSMLEEQQSHCA